MRQCGSTGNLPGLPMREGFSPSSALGEAVAAGAAQCTWARTLQQGNQFSKIKAYDKNKGWEGTN